MNQTIKKLEEIVEREGVDYLHDEPYEVYLELTDAKVCPKNIAGGILLVLLNEILYDNEDIADDIAAFTETISKECGLTKRISEYVACILHLSIPKITEENGTENNQRLRSSFQKIWIWTGTVQATGMETMPPSNVITMPTLQ